MTLKVWQRTVNFLWVGLLLTLPITSMPAVVRLVGSDTVASPSGLFLFALLVFWFIPFVLRRGRLSFLVVPLLGFVLIALITSIRSCFLVFPPYENISTFKNIIMSLVTLGVGAAFYLIAQTLTQDTEMLQKSMRWVHTAGAGVVFWCFVQFAAWHLLGGYPQWLRDFHDLYSIAPLYNNRVSGFALEPSWLAHQLNVLFIPLWLAATIKGHTVYRNKIWKLTVENILLVGGVFSLILSFSRVGWAAFLLTLFYLSIRANIKFVHWIEARPFFQLSLGEGTNTGKRFWISAGISVGIILVYFILIVGLAFIFSKLDPRMEDLFNISFSENNALLEYADSLNFSTRIIYWQAGWKVFNDYPLLGVGLGNSGYFFPQNLSPFAWKLVEVRDLIYRSASLLNTKNLWVRLLSETGIIGFAFFTGWLYVLWQASKTLESTQRSDWQTMGLAGKLMLVALILEGFSIDSFAIPYLWVSSGFVTGAFLSFIHSGKKQESCKGELN